ncbi:methylated-DNA--[protein]-cysteine S-methyltransferase [Sulfuricystis multivorans]|uniref:methylated-DNA--[protein]-cysteine S-methyltransferase n=1 Tax=Sulfuricystis multivorans TaxID=2211108 RepID=UPI0024DF8A7C|nr:methylated-DNA--[protein]-cysteine S-methyltransferase [Sulfuricystis multivorans]
MSPPTPSPALSGGETLCAVLPAPSFSIGIRCNDDAIAEIVYLEPCPEIKPSSALAKEAVRQLRAYLKDPRFLFSLPLALAGTAFQRRVWAGITTIPAGATQTYGELARTLGSSPRAVGNACGANPYPLVIPCHRVVAAGGKLGGFARQRGGFLLEVKRWLLAHEGA